MFSLAYSFVSDKILIPRRGMHDIESRLVVNVVGTDPFLGLRPGFLAGQLVILAPHTATFRMYAGSGNHRGSSGDFRCMHTSTCHSKVDPWIGCGL